MYHVDTLIFKIILNDILNVERKPSLKKDKYLF